ncbi:hypothetical protein WICPIJ_000019 [Wickerhamomyces pijperi]|uniref:Outer spore wall protein 5 n=1 Tax=Wickerhamomyces pijperi TaxID=599730 RepID=A0A9P8QHM9_WICPI|nr:hypothetical protein WICPIJ_000019 [Wickerhamomyces pijperi]
MLDWLFEIDEDNNSVLWKFIISSYKMSLVSSTLSFVFFAAVFATVAVIAAIMIVPLLFLSFIFAGLVIVFNGLSYITFRVASSEYSHTVLFLNRAMRNVADNLPPSVGIVEVQSSNKSVKSNEELVNTEEVVEPRMSFKSIVERYVAKAKYFPLLITRRSEDTEVAEPAVIEAAPIEKVEEAPMEPKEVLIVDQPDVPEIKAEQTVAELPGIVQTDEAAEEIVQEVSAEIIEESKTSGFTSIPVTEKYSNADTAFYA